MRRFLAIAVTVGALLGLAVAALVVEDWWNWAHHPIQPEAEARVHVEIPAGSFQDALQALEEAGLVTRRLSFQVLAWRNDRSRRVQAGAFVLDPRWSPDELLDKLVEGARHAQRRLVIAEGLNIWQIAHRVDRLEIAPAADFLQAAQDWHLAQSLGVTAVKPDPAIHAGLNLDHVSPFEGYLFPRTYALPWRTTAQEVLTRATATFHEIWAGVKSAHRERYESLKATLHLSEHDFVILASLVEKEGVVDAERPLIASVFYNRLREGWKLQTDPTLVYHPDHHTETPTPKHRRDRSNPYNTYAWPGLPPGPIANPGKASLEAVVNPAESDFFFFVARRDGSRQHVFSRTLDGHRKRIQEHLR